MQAIHFLVKSRRYTPIQQLHFLQTAYKPSRWCTRPSGFTWWFQISPTPISDDYLIKVMYDQDKRPEVYVVSPKPLKLADSAERLPHTYNTKSQKLCLYRPKFREWDETMRISDTIVHWAIEWLYYYEHWAFTGRWLGGGHGSWDATPMEN